MLVRVIKHFWTTSQKAEVAAIPSIPQQPEPLAETVLPAVDVTVKTVGGQSPDEAPAATHSQPSPSPEAGSLRRPTAELAPRSITPEPLHSGWASSERKVSSDFYWMLRDLGQSQLSLTWLTCCAATTTAATACLPTYAIFLSPSVLHVCWPQCCSKDACMIWRSFLCLGLSVCVCMCKRMLVNSELRGNGCSYLPTCKGAVEILQLSIFLIVFAWL